MQEITDEYCAIAVLWKVEIPFLLWIKVKGSLAWLQYVFVCTGTQSTEMLPCLLFFSLSPWLTVCDVDADFVIFMKYSLNAQYLLTFSFSCWCSFVLLFAFGAFVRNSCFCSLCSLLSIYIVSKIHAINFIRMAFMLSSL